LLGYIWSVLTLIATLNISSTSTTHTCLLHATQIKLFGQCRKGIGMPKGWSFNWESMATR
jgi:hypothetical protein